MIKIVKVCALAVAVLLSGANADLLAKTVKISKRVCQKLVAHNATADVAYKAGVDVYGRRVAPADLHDYSEFVPRELNIPITVDLFKRMGIDAPAGIGAEANLGIVRYSGGKFTYNGKPLQNGNEAVLAEACREAGFR